MAQAQVGKGATGSGTFFCLDQQGDQTRDLLTQKIRYMAVIWPFDLKIAHTDQHNGQHNAHAGRPHAALRAHNQSPWAPNLIVIPPSRIIVIP